ncbi:MAG: hypothetical protein ACFB9N_15050 [Geitlerinemataceae cyanobacterium]
MAEPIDRRELANYKDLLADYQPGLDAIATLERNGGDWAAGVDELWAESNAPASFGRGRKLWETVLRVLRQELCGDEGFRAQVKEYKKQPNSATLLTGLVVSLTASAGLPIDPAISTIVVLYIVKFGLDVFCEYTEPTT